MKKTTSKKVRKTTTAKRTRSSKATQRSGAMHHAKRIYHATPKFVHGMIAGAFVGVVLVTSLGIGHSAGALTLNSRRDCDDNAVLHCGALTPAEVREKYPQAGAPTIYNYYAISAGDIQSLGETAIAGTAHKDGTITANGRVVAVRASSTGRRPINGSHAVHYGGITFYETTNQAAFASESIPAFVVMKNGAFEFAILAPCGNPLKATSTTKPTPPPAPVKPKPAPPTPKPKPTPPKVTPAVTPPEATPIVTEASTSPAPEQLPNTGPAALFTIAGLSIIGGYIFHLTHHHVRRKRHAKHTGHHA